MKHYLLIFVLSFFGCSKSEVNPSPSYSSVLGTWNFSNATVSGQFNLINKNDTVWVEANSGYFTINSTKFTIKNQIYVTGKYPNPMQISLQSPTTTGSHLAQIFFNPATCKSDYKTMTCSYWQYDPGNGTAAVSVTNNPLTLTR